MTIKSIDALLLPKKYSIIFETCYNLFYSSLVCLSSYIDSPKSFKSILFFIHSRRIITSGDKKIFKNDIQAYFLSLQRILFLLSLLLLLFYKDSPKKIKYHEPIYSNKHFFFIYFQFFHLLKHAFVFILFIHMRSRLFSYSLLGDKAERFQVNPTTGEIVTLEPLDREQNAVYHLTLLAQDSSPTEPQASAVNLTVTVNDLNDNAPRFSSSRYVAYVPDSTNAGKMSLLHFIMNIIIRMIIILPSHSTYNYKPYLMLSNKLKRQTVLFRYIQYVQCIYFIYALNLEFLFS